MPTALPSYVGRYAVRNEIARGGFALVVLAWDEELDSAVALKILDSDRGEPESAVQARFIEEARMLRRIRSHHVVSVHDVGRLNDGRPYFVMDLADRGTLADWLDRQRSERPGEPPDIGTRELAAFADALAEGLGAIHHAGLVHRDIKPANILFESIRPGLAADVVVPGPADPDATVLHPASCGPHMLTGDDIFEDTRILVGDLGIARDVVREDAPDTSVSGTPAYQAPEQLDPTEPITAAADIYAATAVLYHLIVGSKPPRADKLDAYITRVPEAWQDVIRRGMEVDPAERFASIQSWRAAVHDVLAEEAAGASRDEAGFDLDLTGEVTADCPYKGLGAYQPEDAGKFYGREALTEELVRRIQTQNVLVVGGPSGSGKSSLVRAGLVPALRAGAVPHSADWRVALMTPGRDALAELFFQLARTPVEAAAGGGAEGNGVGRIGPDDLTARPALARRLAHPTGSEPALVLCIDQFEELFTLSPPGQRQAFIDALSAMTDPADARVRVVLAVRADYYATCAQIPWLADRITENQVLVGPMTPDELRRAITEPARHAGLYLERNLVDALIEDAGNEAGSLPLVGHALVETWLRRKGTTLTLEGYRAAGGVAGAIAQTAGAIFEQRFAPDEQEAARRLFLRLVTPGEGAGDTRRIVERAEFEADPAPELTARVVEQLTDARLLTVDKRYVQITHEALLRSWPRLRGWIDEARDDLRLRQRLLRHAEEWEAADRDSEVLLRGTSLLTAIDWQAKHPNQGGELLQSYIAASVEDRERTEARRRDRQARTRRFRRAAVAALAVLALGATAASIFAFLGYRDAQRNELRAEAATRQADARFASALGAVAAGLTGDDPRLALYLAGEAAARGEGVPGFDARAAMIAARQRLAENGPHLLGGPIPVGDALSLALSPDGAFLAVGGRDGTVTIIDPVTKQPVGAPLNGHDGGVEDLEFGPDGRMLASAGNDGSVRLWPVTDGFVDGDDITILLDDVAWGLGFDTDGNRLATASEDQTVRLWDTQTGAQIGAALEDSAGDILSVAFSPDGSGLIAGTGSGEIRGWRLPGGGELMAPITDVHTSDIWGLEFAPDGRTFAAISSDRTSSLFSYPEGRFLGHAFEPDDRIQSAVFARSGAALVGGGDDGRIHVWNPKQETPAAVSAVGHVGPIAEIDIGANDRLIATLGADQVVRLWSVFDPVRPSRDRNVSSGAAKGVALGGDGAVVAAADETGTIHVWRDGAAIADRLTGHDHQVWALALSSDGRSLASGDRAGGVRVWDLESGETAYRTGGDGGAVWWLGFTPDGSRLISAHDGGIDILDAGSGDRIGGLTLETGRPTRAAISPDGRRLAATSTDGRVRLFDLQSGAQERELEVVDDVVWSVGFSPDGTSLAVGSSDEVVSLWDVASGERLADLAGHGGGATDVAFLSDGATLAAVDRRGRLHLWDRRSVRRLAEPIVAHHGASWRISAAQAGNLFATAGDDGKVRLWDLLDVGRACDVGQRAFDRDRRRAYFGEGVQSLACAGR